MISHLGLYRKSPNQLIKTFGTGVGTYNWGEHKENWVHSWWWGKGEGSPRATAQTKNVVMETYTVL